MPSPEKMTGAWASRASLTRPITRWRVRARVALGNSAIFFKMLGKLFWILLCKKILENSYVDSYFELLEIIIGEK